MSLHNKRSILSLCQCVNMSPHKFPFDYVPDDVVHNDYHNVRSNCR